MAEQADDVPPADLGPGQAPTLAAALHRAARVGRPGDGLRVLDRRERPDFRTRQEVHDRALRAADTLAAAGVEPGDRVALILPTHLDFFDAFFGAVMLGAVPTPLYPRPPRAARRVFDKTVAMLEAADASVLVVDKRVGRVIGRVRPVVPSLRPARTRRPCSGCTLGGPGPSPTTRHGPVLVGDHRRPQARVPDPPTGPGQPRAIVAEPVPRLAEDGFEHSGALAAAVPRHGAHRCVFPALDEARPRRCCLRGFLARPGAGPCTGTTRRPSRPRRTSPTRCAWNA